MAPIASTVTRPKTTLLVKETNVPRELNQAQMSKELQEREAISVRPVVGEVNIKKPAIDQQQSFELVQTLLLVSFASICYLRNLLPEECFEDRDYAAVRSSSHWPYKQFFQGNNVKSRLSSTTNSQRRGTRKLKVLALGKTAAADKLLFWLDGIFDVLSRSFLSAVQLSIILDKNDVGKVVESYTFNFTYGSVTSIKPPSKKLQGMIISGSHGNPMTISSARAGLEMISRYLIQLTQHLPDLPATRFLTIHLAYTDDCPMEYDPPGFLTSNVGNVLVPDTMLWKMQETRIGQMDTGFHSVNLAVAHLSAVHDEGAESGDDVPIPSNISYTREMPRFSQQVPFIHQGCTSSPNQVENVFSPKQISRQNDETLSHHVTVDQRLDRDPESLINEKLLGMIERQKPADDLVPTQPCVQKLTLMDTLNIWKLNGKKSSELALRRDAFLQHNLSRPTHPSQYGILCECGFTKEEGTLVQCDCCDKMQHQHCYALERRELGETHVCYTCLLEGNEPGLLDRVRDLVQLRRALWAMRGQGVPSSKVALARLIAHDSKQATGLIWQLKDKGFLVDAPGSHVKGFSNKKLPRYHLVDAVIEESLKKDGMLHPLSLIGHHYILHHESPLMSCETHAKNTHGMIGPVPLDFSSSDRSDETESTDEETDELVGVTTQSSDPVSNRRKTSDQKAIISGAVPSPICRSLPSSATNLAPPIKRRSDGLQASRKRARTVNSPIDASDVR